ncbi:hypothetical protein [Desulfosporosinus sp. BICA1-9]|uniref:hypothetical protein n=1 Tax=Desulfosporosinus sp. BICA1-9 TaxID=1531958 RepID=UPI000AA29BE6|nr:hypothetical protein [Desulfosporosinus sp. BICA1-9]HBW36246.1 hypothetical protein [Desulfosporosinus sp.]
MLDKKVSISFCGGCNPLINRGEVANEVQELLSATGIQVTFNSFDTDLVIYLSGCSANCAQRYGQRVSPCVVVAAATIDAMEVDEKQLVDQIVIRVRNLL